MANPRAVRRWVPTAGAGASALVLAALSFATNIAAPLVPRTWVEGHRASVVFAAMVLVLLTVLLAAWAAAHGTRDPRPSQEVLRLSNPTAEVRVEGAVTGAVAMSGHSPAGVSDTPIIGTVVAASDGSTAVGIQHNHYPGPRARRSGQVVVGEIPARSVAFVIREQIAEVENALEAGRLTLICAIAGGRGVGKTQVAAELARRAVATEVEVVAWVNAETYDQMLSDLASVARELGVADPEGDSEKSAHALRTELQSQKSTALLVFDNVVSGKAVAPFVPTVGNTKVIMTSTNRAPLANCAVVDVGVFPRHDSIEYLCRRTGRDDAAGAAALAEALDDSPLGLAQAAAIVGLRPQMSLAEIAKQIHDAPLTQSLIADEAAGSYPRGVAEAILQSVSLSSEADSSGLTRRLLNLLCVLEPGGVSTQLAVELATSRVDSSGAATSSGPEGRVERAARADIERTLGLLVNASLLEWTSDQSGVRMHRLVARAIRDELLHAAAPGRRFVDVAIGAAAALAQVLSPEDESWKDRERLAPLVTHAVHLAGLVADAEGVSAGVTATAQRASPNLDQVFTNARWGIRQLILTADLRRAIAAGTGVLDACERTLGPDHPNTLASLNNLASAYQDAGDLSRAIPLFERALADCERVLGPDNPNTLASRNNLATAYQASGGLVQAIPLIEKTLADCERVLGPDHPNTLTSRNNLASAYQDAGDLVQAIPLFEKTLADRERTLGPQHPGTLASRDSLASAYQESGDLARAIPLFEKTLADCERTLGPDHPNTLSSRNNLGSAYQESGDLARAIPLFEKTLAERERILGPDHPNTLISRNNLASAYQESGDLFQAIPLFEKTLADCERTLGPDNRSTLSSRNNLAGAHQAAWDLPHAIRLFEKTLSDSERLLGSEHPDTLTSRNNLAGAHRVAGDLSQAIPLFEKTLADRERILGPEHPDTLTSRNNLASAYQASGDLVRALPLLEKTLAERERILGPDHPSTLSSRNNLAGAHQAAGDLTQAIPLFERALADFERILGPDHPDTLISRGNVASAYQESGDLSHAIPLFERTLADCERILGPDHPRTRANRAALMDARQA